MLEDKQKDQLKQIFLKLKNDVRLVMFSQEFECEYCGYFNIG